MERLSVAAAHVCETCGRTGRTRVGEIGMLCLACRHGQVVERWQCRECARFMVEAPGRMCMACGAANDCAAYSDLGFTDAVSSFGARCTPVGGRLPR